MRRRSLLAGAALLSLLGCSPVPRDQSITFIFWETYVGTHAVVTVDGRKLFDAPVHNANASNALSGDFNAAVAPGERIFEFRYGDRKFANAATITTNTRFVYLTPLSTPHIQPSDKAYLLD